MFQSLVYGCGLVSNNCLKAELEIFGQMLFQQHVRQENFLAAMPSADAVTRNFENVQDFLE